MSFFQSIILGIIQGITEFLPLSSSGHLILARSVFGWDALDPSKYVAFDVALHVGTLLAALIYFRKEIYSLVFKTKNIKAIIGICISAVPAFFVGFFLEDFADSRLSAPLLVAIVLGVVGAILWFIDYYINKNYKDEETEYINVLSNYKKMFLIGIAQSLALQPGVSRSGATMAMGRFLKISRETAAKVSFLVLIPVVSGAAFFKIIGGGFTSDLVSQSIVGGCVAAIVGLVSINLLLKVVSKVGYAPFAIYRILVAIVAVMIVWTK